MVFKSSTVIFLISELVKCVSNSDVFRVDFKRTSFMTNFSKIKKYFSKLTAQRI